MMFRIGRKIISRSFGDSCEPNKAGINFEFEISSVGVRKSVHMKFVHLCCSPNMYAGYAVWGFVRAIFASSFIRKT